MDEDDDTKSPLDRTLDVFVYLPVGFVLDFRRSIPRYIARGRRQLDPGRLLGRQTPDRNPLRSAPDRLSRLQEQTRNTLRGLGMNASGAPSTGTGRPTSAAGGGLSGNGSRAGTDDHGGTPPGERSGPVGTGGLPAPAASTLDFDASALAITDYDSLSASQVVPRLDSLAPDELETVRIYETATRGRKTILSKIALLQSS